jgi:dienelactone hydrolase
MQRHILSALLLAIVALPAHAAIVTKEMTYKAGDTPLKGYLSYDDSIKGKRPGVLVVHEWWGLNDYARMRARMLAKLGYVALALDMYGNGKQATHPEDAQKFASAIANNMDVGRARFKAAMNLLKQQPVTDANHIAAIGYCFGGGVVLQMARDGLDLDAVVSFHGELGTSEPAQPGKVKARIMVAHGGLDPFTKPEQITGFLDEMNKAGAYYRFIVYSGAKHSFTNPAADEYGAKFNLPLQYNAQADHDSWRDMQEFLNAAFKDKPNLAQSL